MGVLMLAACNPTYNWREVTLGGTQIKALLPCKPDRAKKTVLLNRMRLEMEMAGCELGAELFVVAHVRLPDEAASAATQARWMEITLNNMRATTHETTAWESRIKGLSRQGIQLAARGRREDGRPLMARAIWLAQGADLYQAVVYGDPLTDEVSETFLAGIESR
ncbi:MAG: hypothetical protein OEY75_05430 [Hylemonella sp.]|nr:hypothetical protein [Hylemonella sp.]